MAQNVEQKPENRPARPSEPSHSAGVEDDISDARVSTETDVPAGEDLPDIVDSQRWPAARKSAANVAR